MIVVAVVDDHPLYRRGLVGALSALDDIGVTGAVGSIEEFDRLALEADVVLLDLHLPGIEGADGVAWMKRPDRRVLVVSAAAGQEDVLDAIAAGAAGYLTKDTDADELARAVRLVAGGQTYVSPTLASFLLMANRDPRPSPFNVTDRERDVLELVAQGETDQYIAGALFISIATVRSHLDRIRDKTGARRRADLTRLAIDKGIVRPGSSDRDPRRR